MAYYAGLRAQPVPSSRQSAAANLEDGGAG